MKLSGIISKFLVLTAITTLLSVVGFAKTSISNNNLNKKVEQIRKSNDVDLNSGKVSVANLNQFKLGGDFVAIGFYVQFSGESSDMKDAAIIELAYLIDKLEGQPEAVELQKLFKALIRKEGKAADHKTKVKSLSDSYLKRQTDEQKWFYNVGKASTSILVGTFFADEKIVKKEIVSLQALGKTAPKSTPKDTLELMNSFAKYTSKPKISEADFTAIDEQVEKLVKSISKK